MAKKRQRSRGLGSLFKKDGRGPWIAKWFDHTGKRREASTRTSDRAAAERILSKHVADAALRRDGVVDARADRYATANHRPLTEHLADWKAAQEAKGVTGKQIRLQLKRAETVLAAIHADGVSDLSASAIRGAIGDLRTNGKSLKTCNHYLRAVKQFARWLKADERLRDDPIAHLAGFNAATDRRRERRPLDADEQRWLIDTTASAPAWRQLSGVDRAMLYRVATGTGFRASELRSLTPPSFRLEGASPAVVLRATNSKRRREDLQPIRADLAELLAGWLDGRDADAALWPGRWNEKAAAMIRCDLRRARARWIKSTPDGRERRKRCESAFLVVLDAEGCVVDFHALRGTYITALVKGGASVKVAQELARHSDPKLTMNVYTSLGIHDLAGALDALPSVVDDRPGTERLRATGTYDGSATDAPIDPHQYPHQLERGTVRSHATACAKDSNTAGSAHRRKPLPVRGEREQARSRAVGCDNSGDWIRTSDLRAMNPLL